MVCVGTSQAHDVAHDKDEIAFSRGSLLREMIDPMRRVAKAT